MSPQTYGIVVLSLSVVALLTALFKRQINRFLSKTSVESHDDRRPCYSPVIFSNKMSWQRLLA